MSRFVVLGINYGGHDTAAALMVDGIVVAACEQERYTGAKHTREFPSEAILDCLRIAHLTLDDVNEIALGFDPILSIRETYLKPALTEPSRIGFLIADIDRIRERFGMEFLIREKTGFQGPISFHRHHFAHVASAYYPSGFNDALVYSIDGMGEVETTLLCTAKGGAIEAVHLGNRYPNSFGLIYSAVTFYLGWRHHCDEGIVMGLASYGNPHACIPGTSWTYAEVFSRIIRETGDFDIEIDREWISYHQTRDTWVAKKFMDTFGPKRSHSDPVEQHHKNIAAALQARLEQIILGQLRRAQIHFGVNKLCLAGGVALNCALNGAIEASGLFEEIFVQPASGDQGVAIGACYLSYSEKVRRLESKRELNNFTGARFSDAEISAALLDKGLLPQRPSDLFNYVASKLSEGRIVAWFQGGAEFGPRALGNRSILSRPFPAEMKDHLNKRVKFREVFRPFAAAVLAEHQSSFFDIGQDSPHMLIACKVLDERRSEIPATVHVDGTCRVQTVLREVNPRFHELISEFYKKTDCPVLLNTSFNVKGQPIVNTPAQAIDCFLSTNIDLLVMGDYCIEKSS
jgi:carbamoyltransferase